MSEDKGKGVAETIADEARGLGIEVYRDAAKPAVSQVGQLVGSVTKLVFWPIKLACDTANEALGRLSERLERKAARIPADRLLPPPATIAAPAALNYALLGDGDDVAELREMFENLLVASMDLETTKDAHPAFVTMISQLTRDEARLLRNMPDFEYTLLQVRTRKNPAEWTIVSLFSHGIGIDHERLKSSVSNLERLGILRFDGAPEEITTIGQDKLDKIVSTILVPGEKVEIYGNVYFTPLGEQFVDTCVREPRS